MTDPVITFQVPPSQPMGLGAVRDSNWQQAMKQVDFERAVQQSAKAKERLVALCTCPLALAVFAGLLVMLLLWLMNPPMVHPGGKSTLEKRKPCLAKVIMWGLLAGVVVALSPLLWKLLLR